ncbi:MAG TPA: hypothetical protein PK736_07370, partial [Bacteroidia bacterium]|nr:hypothetical protein [Bacteroidia bacterium]
NYLIRPINRTAMKADAKKKICDFRVFSGKKITRLKPIANYLIRPINRTAMKADAKNFVPSCLCGKKIFGIHKPALESSFVLVFYLHERLES